MSSVYPTGLDVLSTNKSNTTTSVNDHPQHHNDMADAINKIEAELGINPSGTDATVVARLNRIESGGASGTFTGGTITGVTHVTTTDTTHDQFVIDVPTGITAYPMLIQTPTGADLANTEGRWFMAHPEGGLCLSSAREPNWAQLHVYKYGNAQTKPIIRVTNELTAGPQNLVIVDKDGQLVLTPRKTGISPFNVQNSTGATLFDIAENGVVSGRSASTMREPDQIIFRALGYKSWTSSRPNNTYDVQTGGEMRMSAIGLRGGETYSTVYFGAGAAASGATLVKVGIYDTSFNLVASTTNLAGSVNGVVGVVNLALSANFTPAADGLFYIGCLSVGGTAPGIYQIVGGNMNDTNFGTAPAPRYLGWRQSGLSDLPATATRAAGSQPYWFAVS